MSLPDLGRDVFELNDSRKRAMYFFILKFRGALEQGRRRIDNWGGGAHIRIFMFTDRKNNRFQKT